MANFKTFARVIEAQYLAMATNELYSVEGDNKNSETGEILNNIVWDCYLASFPEGTNPIFKERSTYDCSCCRHFVKNIGAVVSIKGGKKTTVWDVEGLEYPFDVVAKKMSKLVKSLPIKSIFRTYETQFGKGETRSLDENGKVQKWDHFEGKVSRKHQSSEVGYVLSQSESAMKVFKRGLTELSAAAISVVLELIKDNNIYRGEEHLTAIRSFNKLQTSYNKCKTQEAQDIFLWENIGNPAARFRNTVIGSLIVDLSKGVDLEDAVKMFESKVAPANYKRPKSLITPAMVKDAVATLKKLGLENAVSRRFAKFEDVSVNNVLFVDNSVAGKMSDGVTSDLENLLMTEAKTLAPDFKKATEVNIDSFMEVIVPGSKEIFVSLKNEDVGNFVSLTAPKEENDTRLFKWNNDFAWSYDGNITDSVQERVKNAGGNVDNAAFRISLSWFNYDDLDLSVVEPVFHNIIDFGRKRSRVSDGYLDVDMNVGSKGSRSAVENISWSRMPQDGVYQVRVHNYTKRESVDVGFDLQVAINGSISNFSFDKVVSGKKVYLEITLKSGVITKIEQKEGIKGDLQPQEKWGIKTNTLTKVQTMMFSPNYWDDNAVGNKHWFFILEGCKNDEPVRGIYNEFLDGKLDKHRKVFEILGDKTKCEPTENQLSGVGFSSTKKQSLNVVVDKKPYVVNF